MADYTLTEANVAPSSAASREQAISAGAISVGAAVQMRSGRWQRAQNNTVANAAAPLGIMEAETQNAGRVSSVLTFDPALTPGITMAKNVPVCVSNTAGLLAPRTDIGASERMTVMMWPLSTSVAVLRPLATGGVGAASYGSATYTHNASNVRFSSAARSIAGTSGAALAVGDIVSLQSGKWNKADDTTVAKAGGVQLSEETIGVVQQACVAADQPVTICLYDPDYTPGFTMVSGDIVVVSRTAGVACPLGYLRTGASRYTTYLGVAKSTTKMVLWPLVTGIANN